MDMSKYKSLFLSDTGDHLDALEGDLVALESARDDKGRIHEIFRHLHSVKGMASSMGYDPMATLAHRLEDLMDHHRETGEAVTSQEADVLLEGVDRLRRQLKAIEEDTPLEDNPPALLAAIEGLTRRGETSQPQPPVVAETSSEQAPADGEGVYQIEATIGDSESSPSVRAFLVYRRMAELGRVLACEPEVSAMRAGRFNGRTIQLRLATSRGVAEIRRLADTLAGLSRVSVRLDTGTTEPPAPSGPPAEQRGAPATTSPRTSAVRIRTELLDFIVNSVGELLTLRAHLESLSDRLDDPPLRDSVRRLNQVVRRLQDRVMEVRMVPVTMLTARLPRVCRDIARSRGKQVEFEITGQEVELDRALVEALDTPVLHLLRNAVDHGIETPDERAAAGKPAAGTIRLSVSRRADRVLFELADDGRGIEPQAIRDRARQLGLLSDASADPDPDAVLDLMFEPGFSTRTTASDVSGRGVGLDAVRNAVTDLGGRVTVRSEPGRGTVFVLNCPLTLAILQVLLVECQGLLLALPASRVLRAAAVQPGQITGNGQERSVLLGGASWPLADLASLLGYERDATGDQSPGEVVLVGQGEQPIAALRVRRVTGHREVVLKSLGKFLRQLGPFGGATVLGDGKPVLILDVDQLLTVFSGPRGEA